MSPASSGPLEVERYIGACLISQNNRSKINNNTQKYRDYFSNVYHPQSHGGYVQCRPPIEGWAGGMPLISFTNYPRRNEPSDVTSQFARLAVHTHGAPLIVTKNFGPRKPRVYNNNKSVQHTKVFENSNNKKPKNFEQQPTNKGVDALSVTSDESSSGSQNSENCLPRIIKPRKRRKKDRKPPPHLLRPSSQDSFSTSESASPDIIDHASLSAYLPFVDAYRSLSSNDNNNSYFSDLLSETPKLHHTFDDVKEATDVNGNQPASTCQCRYCDPAGQIWDVDRSCYSPFLTPPKVFQFPIGTGSRSTSANLVDRLTSMSLEDDVKPTYSRSSSSSSSSGDLEVSTEIVTSLNGHRDIEIKFFSINNNVENKSASV